MSKLKILSADSITKKQTTEGHVKYLKVRQWPGIHKMLGSNFSTEKYKR